MGGPAKNIARYSEAEITGLNMNEYQIKKATKLISETNLQHLIKFDKVQLQFYSSYTLVLSYNCVVMHFP